MSVVLVSSVMLFLVVVVVVVAVAVGSLSQSELATFWDSIVVDFGEVELASFVVCDGLTGGVVDGDEAEPELDLLLTITLDQSIGFSSRPMSCNVCPMR